MHIHTGVKYNLEPVWLFVAASVPSDTQLYISTHVCMSLCVSGSLLEDIQCVWLLPSEAISRHNADPGLCRHHDGWGMLLIPFFPVWIQMVSVTVNSNSHKKIKKKKKVFRNKKLYLSPLPQPRLRVPRGGVAGQHGHRDPDSSNAQRLSSWQLRYHPGPPATHLPPPRVINHDSTESGTPWDQISTLAYGEIRPIFMTLC